MKETVGARHSEAMQYLFLPFNGRSSIFKMWKGNQKCRTKLLKREKKKKKAQSAFGKRTGLLLLCVQLAPAVATEPGLLTRVVWVMQLSCLRINFAI